MKSLFVMAATVMVMMFAVSCKKEYKCICTDSAGAKNTSILEYHNRSNAKAACKDIAASTGHTCELTN